MVDINPINPQSITINVPSNGSLTVNNPGGNTAQVSTNADAQLAYSWACGVGLIQGIDYSAKYWAGKAKESELIAVNAIQGIEDAKDDAIAELESTKNTCLNNIELASDDKIAEIEGLASDYESILITLTQRAETAAGNAETSETNAANSATDAATSATSASTSATNASNSATSASTSATNAVTAATRAAESAESALNLKEDTQTYASYARGYMDASQSWANQATIMAGNSRNSATAAVTARDAAQGYAQQAEQAKKDIEAELDNYVQTSRQINGKDLTNDITLTSSDVGALSNTTKYGSSLQLSLDSSTYVLTATLKDQDGNTLGTSQTVDFPVEQLVMDVNWNSTTKAIDITLKNGTTTSIPASEITNGLQPTIDSTNKLSSDLVDDTNSTHKFATAAQLNQIATNTNNISNLATVATSGSYNDLADKPYIPSGVVIDQTFDGTSANAQSGVAIAGAKFVQNTATGSNSLTILGSAAGNTEATNIGYGSVAAAYATALGGYTRALGTQATALGYYARAEEMATAIGNNSYASYQETIAVGHNSQATAAGTLAVGSQSKATAPRATTIGYGSEATQHQATALGYYARATAYSATAIGYNANGSGYYATAIGYNAQVTSNNSAIQIGYGTNNTDNTLNIGFYNGTNTHYNWQLLDGTTGLIPDARISTNIARTSQIPDVSNFVTNSSLATTLTNYVTTDTAQSISGQKTFTSTIKSSVGNSLALTLSTGDAFGVTVKRTDTNNEIKFGIGWGGDNRGIWDVRHNKWAFSVTNDGKSYALGNEIAIKSDLNSLSPLRYSRYSIAQVNSTNKFIKLASMTFTQSGNRDFSYLFWVEILEASTVKSYALVRLNARWSDTSYTGHKFEILEKYGGSTDSLKALKNLTYAYSLDTKTHKMTAEIWLEIRNTGWVSYYLRPTECNEYGDYSNTPVTLSNNIWTYYNKSGNASSIASTAITSGLTQVKVTDATGVRNENNLSQVMKMWADTKAQYDAIATKDTNTLYNVEGVGLYKGTTLISNDGANKDLSNLSATGQAVIGGKADTDLSNLSTTGKTVIDGQWVTVQTAIATDLNLNNSKGTPYSINISQYLPDDNYLYEVMIDAILSSSATSGQYCNLIMQNSDGTGIYITNCRPRTNAAINAAGNGILIVDSTRIIKINRASNYYGTATVNLKRYRRIGTNT